MYIADIQQQKIEWRRKGWSIPDLRGSKQEWFSLVKELIGLVGNGQASDLDAQPETNITSAYTWRSYASFLKGMGLVSNRAGVLSLTEAGVAFLGKPTKRHLADLMQNKVRLFGETLGILDNAPKTIEEVDKQLCESFRLEWANLSNTRRRMDWLEVFDLIHDIGNRKWSLTDMGKAALNEWSLVTPAVLELPDAEPSDITIADPPTEIALLLQHLIDTPEAHRKRSTYNIWVPSPNRIHNLRVITQFALERVSRTDLFQFVEDEFNLKKSSAESMLPFLKASGLLEEVGRCVYIATPAAKAWCEKGNDLDFVRILHANMRFVGEVINVAENNIIRNDVYAQAKKYNLNTEKVRWIVGFLLEAGLLEEPQYLHLKSTPLGKKFVSTLPLADSVTEEVSQEAENTNAIDGNNNTNNSHPAEYEDIFTRLQVSARDPMAEGKASGVAFEESIAETFRFMGFDAKRIGGSGDTDVIVRWKDSDGKSVIAIVDGKSKSGGTVSHSDISDVAIDTHKDKNNADFVAIVGPGFSGDTIRNHARKKSFALITDVELIEIARTSHKLGLSLEEIALIFQVPDGLSHLDELMTAKQREMDIITLVISKFGQEQEMLGSLSARDLYLLLRSTIVSPSLDELITVFETLSSQEIGVLSPVKKAPFSENTMYVLNGEKRTINRLRALASAIEKGLI
ncbi:restriction endonuclease [Bacillus testis]|uniref:restriction endonuclease n=1 Tax=Bacillus testis TaxID=1622072 RepID=UPI00067F46B5|nr:restriction endonuclease [Bacillus testis]